MTMFELKNSAVINKSYSSYDTSKKVTVLLKFYGILSENNQIFKILIIASIYKVTHSNFGRIYIMNSKIFYKNIHISF